MFRKEEIREAVTAVTIRGATVLPDDVREALTRAMERESHRAAREGLERTLLSTKQSREIASPLCPDTGWPIYYVKIGCEAQIEGGLLTLEEAARAAVRSCAAQGYLRATMKHPLSGADPGDNIGMNIPHVTYQFVPGDALEITYVAKGGGSECFGGTRHRVIAFADGTAGIKKFIIEAFAAAARVGGICPPNIMGIGIGGTADLSAELAKEAACLRCVGSAHPEAEFRALEVELTEALNSLKIGTMGAGGDTSVLGVNVEYAYTHIAGICVDFSCNCMVARRATVSLKENGERVFLPSPLWFGSR